MTPLREYLKMKYTGDCKCGDCQLVPLRVINEQIMLTDAMVKALRAIEWRGHQGKCPLCAGWDMSEFGETPGKHSKDCLVGFVLGHVGTADR